MTTSQTPDLSDDALACVGFPDACGAAAGQPCEPGCPSLATDEAGAPETVGDEDPADEPAPLTYPRITQHGLDVVHHLVDTGYSGDEGIASVAEVIAALQSIENKGRPCMLITPDGAGWVTRVRAHHSGSVDILSRGAEL